MTRLNDEESPGTAPKVTPHDVEASIASEHYFTALDGAFGNRMVTKGSRDGSPFDPALGLLTFCVLVLKNGFTVHGTSACASPENFDAEYGRQLARKKATDEVWPLLGFMLRQQLHHRALSEATSNADGLQPYQRRVIAERQEIEDRLDALTVFMGTITFERLSEAEQLRMAKQSGLMVQLSELLRERIAAFKA